MASDEHTLEHPETDEAATDPLPQYSDDTGTLRRVLDQLSELPV
jgi:hypothetical protein